MSTTNVAEQIAGLSQLELRNIPRTASRIGAAAVRFEISADDAPPEETPAGDDDDEADGPAVAVKTPVKMLARSAQPISHWYWGKIVHDMTGLELAKDRVILDWCHDWDDDIGYLDQFKADEKTGLETSGYLVSTETNDRAARTAAKGKAGVPYEASIEFDLDGSIIEYVGEGQSTQVNGYTLEGPGYVVRRWPLMAVAVCPHGSDANTSTEFSKRGRTEDAAVRIFSKGSAMSTPNAGQNPAPAAPAAEDPQAQFAAKLKKFTERFGAADGAQWAADGKSFDEGLELFAAKLKAGSDAQATEIGELRLQLAAVAGGEKNALSAEPAEGEQPKGKSKFAACYRVKA